MDGPLAVAHSVLQHDRRQLPAFGPEQVTPDMLAQINLADKSVITPWIWGVNIAGIVLITLVVSVRLAVRQFMVHKFFADDFLIIVAVICTLLLCSMSLVAIQFGLGQHIWNLELDTLLDHVKKCIQVMFVGNIAYACAIAFTKFSIIASYIRIFPHQTFRRLMFGCAAVVAGLFLASIPATIFQCKPIAAAWDFSIEDYVCYPFVDFLYASTAISVTTDLVLCLAPLPYFWKLQLPMKQRVLVSCLFAIGGFAAVACIVRISFLHTLASGIDVTYNLVASVLWTMAECAIGIICVSVPTIRPLLAKIAPRFLASQRTRGGGTALSGQGSKSYALGGWSSRSQSNKGESGDQRVQIELADKGGAGGADWSFSRLDSGRPDRVWDGSDGTGPPKVFITTRPAVKRESQTSLKGQSRGFDV